MVSESHKNCKVCKTQITFLRQKQKKLQRRKKVLNLRKAHDRAMETYNKKYNIHHTCEKGHNKGRTSKLDMILANFSALSLDEKAVPKKELPKRNHHPSLMTTQMIIPFDTRVNWCSPSTQMSITDNMRFTYVKNYVMLNRKTSPLLKGVKKSVLDDIRIGVSSGKIRSMDQIKKCVVGYWLLRNEIDNQIRMGFI